MWTEEEYGEVLNGVSQLGWLVLKRFSTSYRPSEVLAAFSSLSDQEFNLLRRLHFGLSDAVDTFLDVHVPAFLRNIPSTTEHTLEERRGSPRGRVDWTRTFARRAQLGDDPTRFVTRPTERTSDSGAGRLVGLMLARVAANATWLTQRSIPELARERLEVSGATASRHLAVLRSRGVRIPNSISLREIGPLRRARRPDVSAAVLLFDLHVGLIEQANENLLRALLRDRQMAPENCDDLFEVWALLTLVERHLNEGWQITDAQLIGAETGPRRPRFTLAKMGDTVSIYYQIVPTAMAKSSVYKDIFNEYDLSASVRRPDITASLSSADVNQTIIIEVKRTSDKGYITDSVYKTLGYLSDFRSTIGPDTPQALLLVWKGIEPVAARSPTSPIHILTAQEYSSMSLPY
jgi:hypothetical protein